MTFVADAAYLARWRQRQRDRHCARKSNAKNRCVDCRVEICAHAIRCSVCGSRKMPSRRGR